MLNNLSIQLLLLLKQKSNQRIKSASSPSSKYRILPQKDFDKVKIHMIENNLSVQASEKIYFIESDRKNRTRSGMRERTLCLEMNETEFWSVNSE